MAALVTGNQATTSVIERGLNDSRRGSPPLRRGRGRDRCARSTIASACCKIALADKEPRVRFEALRALGPAPAEDLVRADPRGAEGRRIRTCSCRRSISWATACPAAESPAADLTRDRRLARRPAPRAWHAPAHAIVSLARIQPDAAAQGLLPRYIAASAPGRCGCMPRAPPACCGLDRRSRHALAPTRTDNVREAALAALIDLKRPEAAPAGDRVADAHRLSADPDRGARARGQVERAEGHDAAADGARPHHQGAQGHVARSAHGDPQSPAGATAIASQAVDLEGYLKDFDPAIAQKAAEILTAWTGKPRTAAPQPLTPPGVTTAMVDGAARQVAALPHGGPRLLRHRPRRRRRAAHGDPHRAARRRGLLQRPDLPPHRAELRDPGRQPRRQRIHGRALLHARRGRPPPAAARSASRRAAATPATRRSSSTSSTRRGSITSTPCSAPWSPAWTWSTASSKAM